MNAGSWWAAHAHLPGGIAQDVRFEIVDGRFSSITAGVAKQDSTVLAGVAMPGFADVHGHAFHRALRGRTHQGTGSFWTWRETMYALAQRLDPDTYLALARATYAELAMSGVSTVGEFHYLHHGPGGARYDDPNEMAQVLRQAAADAGVRLTLIDACYLRAGLRGEELNEVQARFADRDFDAWATRVAALKDGPSTRIAYAAHSVRAVAAKDLARIAQQSAERPLHLHLSEQPAENAECLEIEGMTPTQLLDSVGVLGPQTVAVHATHLSSADVATLGARGVGICACPSTERDLADGIGAMRALADAGARLSLGTDQHVAADVFAEARGLEENERVVSLTRGRFDQSELLAALTAHDQLGWSDAGRLEVGARADLVAVRTDSIRTAGSDPSQIVMSAAASDVDTVLVEGRRVVESGRHILGDVGQLLAEAIEKLWR